MPQPVSYNPGTPVSGSIQENSISYVVDGQNRNYRGGYGGLSWMSEVPAANNVIFIGNSVSLGRGPANIPLFYPSYNNSAANIIYAANTLPGSPRNFTTTGSAYNWAATNNFFINNSNNPIPRIDANSMFLCLDAEQATSFPQIGTSWYDMSGANYTVTGTNNPTWNYGNGRSYWRFDGIDDYFAFSSTPPIAQSTYTSTVEVWAKSTDNTPTFQVMFGGGVQNTNQGYYYGFRQNNANFMYAFYANDQDGSTPRDNRVWNHYVAVYNQSTGARYRYFNGELLSPSQASGVTATSANSFTIGAYKDPSAGPQYFYNGYISKVRGYSKELTQAEIKQNYFQSNIVQDGLLFMVDANNIVSYEGSGTTWYNLTGSVASATLTNGPIFSNTNGGIINFDGVDDYAVTSNFPSLSNWSTEMWLNPNVYTTAQRVILDVNLGIRFEISNGFFNSHFGDGSGWIYTNLPSTTQIAPNTWFHVIVTVQSGGQAKVYVNGILENTINIGSGTTPSVPLYIARFTGAGGYEFNGKIANTRIYSKALSSSEVQQNYQSTKDKFLGENIVTNGLVLNLDAANKDSYPGTGTTWYTLVGSDNGTLINGTSFSTDVGGCMVFDGVDDYVSFGNPLDQAQLSQVWTVQAWINITTKPPQILVEGLASNLWIEFYQGNNSLLYLNSGANDYYTYGGQFTSQGWVLATFRFNNANGDRQIWRNLSNISTGGPNNTSTPAGQASTFYIGSNGSATILGKVGNLLVYNKYLTDAEITQNYNAQKTRFGL
jgi:hypothetical protein